MRSYSYKKTVSTRPIDDRHCAKIFRCWSQALIISLLLCWHSRVPFLDRSQFTTIMDSESCIRSVTTDREPNMLKGHVESLHSR